MMRTQKASHHTLAIAPFVMLHSSQIDFLPRFRSLSNERIVLSKSSKQVTAVSATSIVSWFKWNEPNSHVESTFMQQ